MEFWASEVKSGATIKVKPGEGMVLHLSQASLGEIKKEKGEQVSLFVNVNEKKLVLGTLLSDKLPQQQFDLVFDRDFELSHNWKNGSVYFYGYLASNPYDDNVEGDEFESESDSESEEEIPLGGENGKPVAKAKKNKLADAKKEKAEKDSAAGKQNEKIVEPGAGSGKDGEDEDSSDEDSMSESEDDSDMNEDEDESDSDDEDEEDDSDEETPKKVATGKKRGADSAIKTPMPDKKTKLSTPQKTDGKKGGGHVATPHPSKQAGKTPANKNPQTPKSGGGGSHTCKSCSRSFGSGNALESHTKAKHSGGK